MRNGRFESAFFSLRLFHSFLLPSIPEFSKLILLYQLFDLKINVPGNFFQVNFDAFARKPKCGWLSKKSQMQGAQLLSDEA
jgi:hypothetical protein